MLSISLIALVDLAPAVDQQAHRDATKRAATPVGISLMPAGEKGQGKTRT
jgi:hypothetical protein